LSIYNIVNIVSRYPFAGAADRDVQVEPSGLVITAPTPLETAQNKESSGDHVTDVHEFASAAEADVQLETAEF
jgi:hypothetical protein